MAKQQVVRVSIVKEKASLSKAQKEFNELTRQIEKTERDLVNLREAADRIQQRVEGELRPLLKKLTDVQVKLVKLYDRAAMQQDLSRGDQRKLAQLITEITYDLIGQHGIDALKPIHDKYSDVTFDERVRHQHQSDALREHKRADEEAHSDGVPIEEEDSWEKAEAEAEEWRRKQADEERAARPKSEKQRVREAKRAEEARNITRSVRALYMDLVKTFHPDREPDEVEKIRKTEIMQRVTQAYDANDLLGLLRLQMEFNRIDQEHLETLADEQLGYYNKILKGQVAELDAKLFALQSQLGRMLGSAFGFIHSPVSLDFNFNTYLNQVKKMLKASKSELEVLSDTDMLKLWLKGYR
ncbi:hypothetical protein F5984_05290 [Rudanella paleaurantiibacter]|uniref:Molecular chaperone DnaJ n=1 Tax=Rudanella paleaurantiibacter TaxID=2614655 RepID=A0A7J5U1I9_9BACT|nr:hypothetical protein [Rudanella paleaurantiibacter]KAB7731647.1 hypothetical protein F5984_05290 [Rudanella paleaurantiibacter]